MEAKNQSSSFRTVYDLKWDDAYQRLCAFREQHGHTNVSYRYKNDLMLGRWGKCQIAMGAEYQGTMEGASFSSRLFT
jgi:hypothetical protein